MIHSRRNRVRILLFALWTIFSMIPGCARKEEQKQSSTAAEDRTSMILEQYRLQRASVESSVALRIRVEMEKAKASYFSIQQARIEKDAARKTLDIVADSYSRGAVSILSLLDAQNSALRADKVAANAFCAFFTDCIALKRAIGEIDVLMTPDQRKDLLQRLRKHMVAAGIC